MSKTKIIAGILLIAAMLFTQTGTVFAAPQAQDVTTIAGTIVSITTETDELGVTTVLVTLLDDMETEQTVRLDVDTAVALGLVTLDPVTMDPIVDETQVGMPVEIDPTTVIPDEESTEEPMEETNHPISVLLAAFFGEDAGVIDGYHEEGIGFGVIAQAFWMSQNYGGDASLAGVILEAKTTGDYSAVTLPDGTVPTNWGQFKKALSEKKNNLGSIVSGHTQNDTTEEQSLEQSQPGNGNNNGKGNSNKDKDKSNNGKGNGKNK